MRRLVLMKYCGVCWVEDKREVQAAVSLPPVGGKDIDLCEEHATKIPIKLLAPTLEKYGTRADLSVAPPRKQSARKAEDVDYPTSWDSEDKLICRVKGCKYGPEGAHYKAKNPQGLGAHKRSRHGIQGKVNPAPLKVKV